METGAGEGVLLDFVAAGGFQGVIDWGYSLNYDLSLATTVYHAKKLRCGLRLMLLKAAAGLRIWAGFLKAR